MNAKGARMYASKRVRRRKDHLFLMKACLLFLGFVGFMIIIILVHKQTRMGEETLLRSEYP